MIYHAFQDLQLPALAVGTMRLPVTDGNDANIDAEATREMVAFAMESGANYFDTAWGYHGGNSESVMGELLSAYPRESFMLADKFPGYDLSNMSKVAEIFEEQLRKCRTDYFDFYLIHNLCELNIDEYLDPRHGIIDYLLEQKRMGRIRHLGLSTHGSFETTKRFLDALDGQLEFCQVQLNWLDWEFQDAKAKVELLNDRGIPVFVMEPMRGGGLLSLKPEYEATLAALAPDRSLAEWAIRFLQSVPGVSTVLTGASSLEQLKQNIALFATEEPLSAPEHDALISVARAMTAKGTVPCTACRYCTDHCPQGLDIPWLLELYNEHAYSDGGFIAPMALGALPQDKQPSACIACGACEAVCPQQIPVAATLADFVKLLESSDDE